MLDEGPMKMLSEDEEAEAEEEEEEENEVEDDASGDATSSVSTSNGIYDDAEEEGKDAAVVLERGGSLLDATAAAISHALSFSMCCETCFTIASELTCTDAIALADKSGLSSI